jgi:hypothetical protein
MQGAMTMNRNEVFIWLVVGLVPYRIKRQYLAGNVRTLEVQALFWSLVVRLRASGLHDWTLRVPLIEQMKKAIWAAVMQLWGDKSLQE